MYSNGIKRILDVTIAIIVFVLFLPIFIMVAVLLSFVNKGSAFFLQKRPGLNEKIFTIIKFKTMTDGRDEKGNLLSDNLRLTRIGNFVRKTSLDEIPQLLNVIKGDMSIIGPRPLLVEYLSLYNKEQKSRHNVRPGITGWAQINGRNTISWDEKFKHDIWYVNNLSFKLDVKIIMLTFIKVFKSEGINTGKNMTMNRFKGNN